MTFRNVDEAIHALENYSASPDIHMEAIRYLANLDECYKAKGLVHALQSDDVGVRWEAGNLLAKMGESSLPIVLKALTDPDRVGDPRLRDGVAHMIHSIHDPDIRDRLASLLKAVKGSPADVKTMCEANRLLQEMDPSACAEGIE